MPSEITKEKLEEIVQLTIDQGGELRTKRSKDIIKLKFRTKKRLYTIKLPLKEAEALISELSTKITVVSFS
ncbi:MAG: 50S ribosomal protein L38e [Candidatus Heimdallarchaeota archaeon]|nr:50S ribosomal protein L38e [Candidatus Heimdallarchaeota archaeon]